jgi:hypothetical protein
MGFPETSVTKYESMMLNIPEDQTWSLTKVPICCPETSVTNYRLMLRNISEERRSHLHLGGILISRICTVGLCAHCVMYILRASAHRVCACLYCRTTQVFRTFRLTTHCVRTHTIHVVFLTYITVTAFNASKFLDHKSRSRSPSHQFNSAFVTSRAEISG